MLKRILIIDDDLTVCQMLSYVLGAFSVDLYIEHAFPGVEAIAQIQPDLILLDIHLPYPDGITVLQNIRLTPAIADLPVIVITADDQSETLEALRLLNPLALVPKPFSPKELRNLIQDLIWAEAV